MVHTAILPVLDIPCIEITGPAPQSGVLMCLEIYIIKLVERDTNRMGRGQETDFLECEVGNFIGGSFDKMCI